MSDQPIQIANEMIRASAGTGKTYQLTNRFIRLLLCGLPPDRIIALTFTRKAAGEFFEGIRPANTIVQAGLVGDGILVEVEAEAILGADDEI